MSAGLRVDIRGARELAAALGDGELLDAVLRPGFTAAGTLVMGDAKGRVHKVTRKLATAITSRVEGRGIGLEARVGPGPGLDQPRGYRRSDTGRWKTPRAGKNTGDPRVYAIYEERGTRYRRGHPFLEPALAENVGEIETVIARKADEALAGRIGR